MGWAALLSQQVQERIPVVKPHLEYCIQLLSLPAELQVQQKTIRMKRKTEENDFA